MKTDHHRNEINFYFEQGNPYQKKCLGLIDFTLVARRRGVALSKTENST